MVAHPRLSLETRAAIEQLLREGLACNKIARRVGVSRRTVQEIARGDLVSRANPFGLAAGEKFFRGGVRCENGHRVYVLPCRTCRAMTRAKAAKARATHAGGRHMRRKPAPPEVSEPITLALRPDDRARLEDVRKARPADPPPPPEE